MPTKYAGTTEERRALDTFIKLVRATESVNARLQAGLADGRVTGSQFGVLEALLHLGPLNQCDLGRKLLKSSGNMTMVVDNLEKRGLVRRVRDVEDRRYVTVHLTDEGRELIEAVFPRHAAGIAAEMSVLTAAEQEELGRLCRKLGLQETA